MKRKPVTKQAVKNVLAYMVKRECLAAREATSDYCRDSAANRAQGAITLAYLSDAIDDTAYSALWDLASNARSQRSTEMLYAQPPYTGAAFAKAKRYPEAGDPASAAA